MAFVALDGLAGSVDLTLTDKSDPGIFSLVGSQSGRYGRGLYPSSVATARDPILGGGEFVYVSAYQACTAGQIVQFFVSQDLTTRTMKLGVTPWTGAANLGLPLGVCYVALPANYYGWVQIGGFAITNATGTINPNDQVYWSANGIVTNVVANGKHMIGAQFATATGATLGTGVSVVTLPATQAIAWMQYPVAQGLNT
jgi:hypothetical protein